MFEKATRMKLRFPSAKGLLSVEDLWDLPLTSERGVSLDGIAQALFRELKDETMPSFVNPTVNTVDAIANLKLNIVKHVIAVRKEENMNQLMAREKAAKRQRILEIMAERKEGQLATASDEELQKLLTETQ